jgi:uncharacterized LabA/DUF88 family protein
MEKQRVIVYVDGFNFYYGLKTMKWKKFYWLDIVGFFERMLTPDQELMEVHYFSARPINDQSAYDNQNSLFLANKLNPKFKLTLGKFLKKEKSCKHHPLNVCNSYEEKETDVRIATQIINDVYKNRCDITIVVSADSDMIPALELIRDMNHDHPVYVYFPPLRHSVSLTNIANGVRKLSEYKVRFRQSVLPNEVTLPNGYVLKRPVNWY